MKSSNVICSDMAYCSSNHNQIEGVNYTEVGSTHSQSKAVLSKWTLYSWSQTPLCNSSPLTQIYRKLLYFIWRRGSLGDNSHPRLLNKKNLGKSPKVPKNRAPFFYEQGNITDQNLGPTTEGNLGGREMEKNPYICVFRFDSQ